MSVFAVPGWVRVMSVGSRSFAACGRDAGLKTGAPAVARHPAVPTGGLAFPSLRATLRRREGEAMSVFAVPGWVRVVSGASRGSFAACGRDAGLKTGVPFPAASWGERPSAIHGHAGRDDGRRSSPGELAAFLCYGRFVEVARC